MKEQLEKDVALIGRYCDEHRTSMYSHRVDRKWRIAVGPIDVHHERYDEAVHQAAVALAARIDTLNQKAVRKAAEQLATAQTVVGDWSAEA